MSDIPDNLNDLQSQWSINEIRQLIREEIAKAQLTIQVITPPNYTVKQETMVLTEDGHETLEEYRKARGLMGNITTRPITDEEVRAAIREQEKNTVYL